METLVQGVYFFGMAWPHVPLDYSRITPEIYIGTNACCRTHFNTSLRKMGIRADISLEQERLDAAKGAEYFVWLPTKDKTAPTIQKLRLGAHAIRELVDEGEAVYVHCMNGHGRAPTLVAAYFILMGDSVDEALARIKKKRPQIHLERSQLQRLKEFERWCARHRRKGHL
jgi:hypothetical protein